MFSGIRRIYVKFNGFVVHDSAFFRRNLFLHYIGGGGIRKMQFFKLTKLLGGGGGAKRYVCPPPPNIFIGGGGRLPPSSPRVDASGGKRLGRARGDVYSGGSRICKKGVGGKIRARSAPCVREAHRARVSARLIRVGSRGPP